jgi:hypothetical protein
MEFPKLCTPALIYLVLAVISLLMMISGGVHFISLVIKIVFVFLWTWLLNFLCNKGLGVVSWILVILPFVIVLGIVAGAYETVIRNNNGLSPV